MLIKSATLQYQNFNLLLAAVLVELTPEDVMVFEGKGYAELCVTVTPPTIELGSSFNIDAFTENGTAGISLLCTYSLPSFITVC